MFRQCKKAFDTENRDWFWYKLLKVGFDGHMLSAIKSLGSSVSRPVRNNNI